MTTIGVLVSAHTPRVNNGMLQRCLNSVLVQERAPDAIVVAIDHDGSGAAATKQRALKMLDTDLVAVIDSDDEMLPDHLAVLEAGYIESGASVVYSWFETSPPGGDPFPEFFFSAPWDDENPRHTTTTILAERFALLASGGYTEDPNPTAIYADDDWRLIQSVVDSGYKIYHVPKRTWIWHHHQTSTSGLAKNWRQ